MIFFFKERQSKFILSLSFLLAIIAHLALILLINRIKLVKKIEKKETVIILNLNSENLSIKESTSINQKKLQKTIIRNKKIIKKEVRNKKIIKKEVSNKNTTTNSLSSKDLKKLTGDSLDSINLLDLYKNSIRNRIQDYANKKYPRKSLKKNEGGIVEIIFKLDVDGNLIDIKKGLKTKASKTLIRAAFKAVENQSPFKKNIILKKINEFSILIVYKIN